MATLFVRLEASLFITAEVSHIEAIFGKLENISEKLPGPGTHFFLQKV